MSRSHEAPLPLHPVPDRKEGQQMIQLLMGFGLGKRAAQLIGFVVVPALVVLGFYLALDAYGDSRFRAGVEKTDAAWKKANDKLVAQAASSATAADKQSTARAITYAAQAEEEKEKIDDAIQNGTSPDGVR
jgi:hypothetical protein